MGRKKAYKPAALRRAVQEYFAALRYREPVYREEPVLDDDGQPEFDRYGHPATRFVRVVTEDGTPASRTSWVSPPTITGLCGKLGRRLPVRGAGAGDVRGGRCFCRATAVCCCIRNCIRLWKPAASGLCCPCPKKSPVQHPWRICTNIFNFLKRAVPAFSCL